MARLNLGWLKPPKVPADGVMSLGDHLREFRYRVVISALAILLGMVVCAFFNREILGFMLIPWNEAQAIIKGKHENLDVQIVLQNVTSPLVLVLRVVAMGGLVLTSPFWLYQVWAYLRPALLRAEKKYALAFIGAAVPLFLFGCALGFVVLPQGISLLLSFTPDQLHVVNQIHVDDFLVLVMQLMLIFGLGFLLPLVVVALNLVGLLSGATLKKSRKGVVFGCFVFAGALTPGGDPFSMLALSLPMMILFLVAEMICHANDKRRAKRLAAAEAAEAAETAARLGQAAIQA